MGVYKTVGGAVSISGLVVATMLAGCSAKLTSITPVGKTPQKAAAQPAADSTLPPPLVAKDHAPINCQPLGVAPATGFQIQEHFQKQAAKLEKLTRKQYRELFVDTDAKGNVRNPALPDGASIDPWSQKDLSADKIPGTSTEKAYAELGLQNNGAMITVAVLDSGMDITHEVLAAHIDHQGWNFLGSADGANVYSTNLEVTREVRRLRKLRAEGPLGEEDTAYQTRIEKEYDDGMQASKRTAATRTKSLGELTSALDTLRTACKVPVGTLDEVNAVQSSDDAVIAAKQAALKYLANGWTVERFHTSIAHWNHTLETYYNLDFDPSAIVGDHPDQLDEKGYGNNEVMPVGSDEEHATHVAGIIGAVRGTAHGINGQANRVRILSIRAVPDGDERDKDIANGIRYAVDHGARVINMSFGKDLSPNKEYVWDAIRYARANDVLLVHAAGNDSENNDVKTFYPSRYVTDKSGKVTEVLDNVIEVGASTRTLDADLPAIFSDYGQTTVDLFAPGAMILSSIPGNQYAEFDGTSMATPEVAGIAALVLSQYPKLNVSQLKKVLLDSAQKPSADLLVNLPSASGDTNLVPFKTLSITGGVVNAYEALKAAAKL
ncbi:MAG: S8 family serine peptidase [Bdellovibrionota bacterium]